MAGRSKAEDKMWGGRFSGPTDELLESFSASVHFDYKLYPYDIMGSIAHARMLGRQGLVSEEESRAMVEGLQSIKADIDAGRFKWDPKLEDVHMNIERVLAERIGPAGEKLHTARSRNDQVALDTRLYVRDALKSVQAGVRELRLALVRRALENIGLIMPGYTHLQRAQPILLSHHLAAYQEMLSRDSRRLDEIQKRVDVMPLGSAALAGTGLPIDMKFVARELGFSKVSANSLDAVSDRDYVIEFISAGALIMMHLSRLSEDIILWSSSEFGFADLPDELATGSSIMPQKKNPDVPELIRGKTGRVYGHLLGLLTMMKGLPLAYNRDMQEDKEPLFDTVETLVQVLPLLARLVERLRFNGQRMRDAADDPFIAATDLADHLVRQGVPFRRAHSMVGQTVDFCSQTGRGLGDLTPDELARFCPEADPAILNRLGVEDVVKARTTPGGTSPQRVKAALKKALKELER